MTVRGVGLGVICEGEIGGSGEVNFVISVYLHCPPDGTNQNLDIRKVDCREPADTGGGRAFQEV